MGPTLFRKGSNAWPSKRAVAAGVDVGRDGGGVASSSQRGPRVRTGGKRRGRASTGTTGTGVNWHNGRACQLCARGFSRVSGGFPRFETEQSEQGSAVRFQCSVSVGAFPGLGLVESLSGMTSFLSPRSTRKAALRSRAYRTRGGCPACRSNAWPGVHVSRANPLSNWTAEPCPNSIFPEFLRIDAGHARQGSGVPHRCPASRFYPRHGVLDINH